MNEQFRSRGLLVGIVLFLLLTSCKPARQPVTTPWTLPASVETQAYPYPPLQLSQASESAYPGIDPAYGLVSTPYPQSGESPEAAQTAYPGVLPLPTPSAANPTSAQAQTAPTVSPLPPRDIPATTSSPGSATPQMATGTSTLAAEATSYPPADGSSSVFTTSTPYPAPGLSPVVPSPYPPPDASSGTGTPPPSSPAPGGTPTPFQTTVSTTRATPTLTPALVSTRLKASDPSGFEFASGKLQLVEFFAFWSPASKSMAPVMDNLQERYKDRVMFTYLDIDDPANGLFKTLLNDRLPPVFFLLDAQGNVLQEWRGYVRTIEFENAINSNP